jgi:hypothetical protein
VKRPDYNYFIVETCSLIITQSIYVVLDCIFQYIIYYIIYVVDSDVK